MGLRLLPLLALMLLGAACATGAGAQRGVPARPPADAVSVIASGSDEGERVRINETVSKRGYQVAGTSAAEIRANLLSESTPADGRRYDALTNWEVHWTFRYERRDSFCGLAAASITVAIEVRLPDLATPDSLAPDVLARWQAYTSALEAHELGHVDRETSVLQDLKDAFEGSGAGPELHRAGPAPQRPRRRIPHPRPRRRRRLRPGDQPRPHSRRLFP